MEPTTIAEENVRKINEISIIMPCEDNRVILLLKTLDKYIECGHLENVEFLIPSRTLKEFSYRDLDIKLLPYSFEGPDFNPSMALNLALKNAKYENIVVTCPEVRPLTPVISQLKEKVRGNYVCKVYDMDAGGRPIRILVSSTIRYGSPAMYFLACYKKEDILAINGWDEDYMQGNAYEDDDFGMRFKGMGLPWTMEDNIEAEHQYHPRNHPHSGIAHNARQYNRKCYEGVYYCKNGVNKC